MGFLRREKKEVSPVVSVSNVEEGKENRKKMSPEEINGYKKEMGTIVDNAEKIKKDEDKPVVFRDRDIFEKGHGALYDLDKKIKDSAWEKDKKIPTELSEEITKCDRDVKGMADELLPELKRIQDFRVSSKKEKGQYPEEERERYQIEVRALDCFDYERKIEKARERGEFSEEETRELLEELDKTKASISKEYADLRRKEREKVEKKQEQKTKEAEEERRKTMEELRTKIKELGEREIPEEETKK